MKTIKSVSILMLCLLTSYSFGQNLKPLAREVQKSHQNKETFVQIDNLLTVSQNSQLSATVAKEARDAQIFSYNKTLATEIINNRPQALTFDISLDNEIKTIEVVQVKQSFNDYIVNTASGTIKEGSTHQGIHYRGIVLGDENSSLVALSIFKNELIGVISMNSKGDFTIGKLVGHDDHVMYNDANLLKDLPFECLSDEASEVVKLEENGIQMKSSNPEDYCIDVYFEIDYEIYQNEGSSVPNTETFVTGLFNQTAAIYQNESITVQISEIFVWDTPDSYNNTSISTARNEFVSANPTFNGDLAQLLEYSSSGGGGIAYGIGGLCGGTSSPGPYAATSLFPAFSVVPTYSRQVKVLTHEMGHNLGSRHTHACVWNGDNTTFDDYGNYQSNGTFIPGSEGASCVDQMNPKLSETPTIMSYYDSRGHGTFAMSNGFGDQPGDVIRAFVLAATCLDLCAPETCNTTITSFPYSESFETDLGDWQQSASDDFDWTRDSGGTSSVNTGPSNAADGTFYAYTESSLPNNPNKTAILSSPCFDLTGQDGTNLGFAYHMYGASMGTLDLQVSDDNGVSWTSEWTTSGDQGNQWNTANVDLSSYSGSTIQLRFVGTTSTSYTSDMAIDDISVYETFPCNTEITSYPYTESFETDFGAWEQAVADDFNWTRLSGSTTSLSTGPTAAADGSFYAYTESSYPNYPSKQSILVSPCFNLYGQSNPVLGFQYHMYGSAMGELRLDVSEDNGVTWTTLWTMNGNKGNFWLPATVDLSAYEGSTIQLRYVGTTSTSFTSDMAVDDISITTEPCIGTINTFPYVESFETDFGLWAQDLNEDFDWSRNSGGTSSVNTGPTAAQDGLWYAYTESSFPNHPSKAAHLLSPCIDLTGQSTIVMNFWYHMYGATIGTLAVEASNNGGASWTTLFVRTGDQGNVWSPASVNLSAYAGQTISVRIVGKTTTSFTSDIAVDDITINTLKSLGSTANTDDLTFVEQRVHLYPNPASDYTIVDASLVDVDVEVVILDMLGKEMYRVNSEDAESMNQFRIPTGTFAPGTYMVVVKSNTGEMINKKLVVRE